MARETDLLFYLPTVIQGVREFQEIAATETKEFNRLFLEAEDRLSDSFIREATVQGIKRYETMLKLAPDSRLTLEERRTKVLIKWNRQLPYTLRRLVEQLELWSGEEPFTLDISRFKEYELQIEIFNQTLEVLHEIKNLTGEMIPANLVLFLYGRFPSEYDVPVRYENAVHIQTNFHPRYNLPFLRLDRTWKLNGSRLVNGYDSDDVMDFYPAQLRVEAGIEQDIRIEKQMRLVWESKEEVKTDYALAVRSQAKETTDTAEWVIFRSTADIETAAGIKLCITQEVKAGPMTGCSAHMQAAAEQKVKTGEQARVQAEAAYILKTAGYMTKMNQFNCEWKLNGSRTLDGGSYTL